MVMFYLAVRIAGLLTLTVVASSCAFRGKSADINRLPTSTVEFTLDGKPLKVSVIDTGSIQIKGCHLENCVDESASYPWRLINILTDSTPAPRRLPILTYLIQHPEGDFLIDTGADPEWDNEDSWECSPRAHFASRRIADVKYAKDHPLKSELRERGLRGSLKVILITHGHFDHTGGLKELRADRVIIGKADLESHDKIGAVRCKYLDGVDFSEAEYKPLSKDEADPYAVAFDSSPVSITSDKSLRFFVVPGHTPGSIVVAQRVDQGELLFVGDITFKRDQIRPDSAVAGMHFDIPQIRKAHSALRALSERYRVLVLPSHDEEIVDRLAEFPNQGSSVKQPSE